MVDLMATVTSAPSYFMGTKTHAEHEEFLAQTTTGPIDVIDNVDLAPRVPVEPGDQIEVCGEMVHDPGKPVPIVHWTHHDPAHRHPDGFIRFRGQVYA
ncbi:MAG: DUF3465 domain-containing protein [Candidatus Aquilonibacter sp.]|jgi:hypothetical protein